MTSSVKLGAAWALRRSGVLAMREHLRRGRVGIVLMYHRVNDDADPFFPALGVEAFAAQLEYLNATYRVEPLEGLLRWVHEGAPGPPRVALTIDDGYADTYGTVLPRLRARRIPATLFLATDPPESGRLLWLDRLRLLLKRTPAEVLEVPEHGLGPWPLGSTRARLAALGRLTGRLKRSGASEVEDVTGELWHRLDGDGISDGPAPLTWAQLRELQSGGVAIGGHTHRHYVLSQLGDEAAREEIATSMALIRERLGCEPTGFAYPNGENGDYGAETIGVLRDLGVPWACCTLPGFATRDAPQHEIPRLYTSMDSLSLFACRVAGLTRLRDKVGPTQH
jgi:peptidoglycan/xylan/chitin deacetylase (PgdA/CDA1 family)